METIKYKVIKSKRQYNNYCSILEELTEREGHQKNILEEIELLTLLIEKWDLEHTILNEQDPVEILHSLMLNHKMKAKDLVDLLGVSKSLVSDILNYKKGMSKEIIRILSSYFKISQEAFNRPYKLKGRFISPKLTHA